MNISQINVALTGKDILSIINEFVSIEGLKIEDISIKDSVIIKGNFKKGIGIDFECSVKVKSSNDSMIIGQVLSFKIINLGIPNFLRKIIFKYALKSLSDKGITYENGEVYIQYKYILKDIPYIDLSINSIFFTEHKINICLDNIEISLNGALKKEVNLFVKEEVYDEESEEKRGKTEDIYTLGRKLVENKIPGKVRKYSDYIFILPDIAALLIRLLKDDRVKLKTKLIISGAAAYVVFPTDLIPDKIPFIGAIDELAIAFFAINRIVEDVPIYIILENWQGENDIILVIRNLIEYVSEFTGAKNIETLYNFIDDAIKV